MVSVKIDANVSDHCLSCVNDLWRSLTNQFALHQSAVILHNIAEGCLGNKQTLSESVAVNILQVMQVYKV